MAPPFKDYEHLLRLIGLFVFGTLLFFAVRAVAVPKDFGKYGHYRPGALDANASKPIKYAGHAACTDCHTDIVEKRHTSRHERINCETCHGPLAQHAKGEAEARKPDPKVICIRCHAASPDKPKWFPQVNQAEHAGGESCTTCHDAHTPKIS